MAKKKQKINWTYIIGGIILFMLIAQPSSDKKEGFFGCNWGSTSNPPSCHYVSVEPANISEYDLMDLESLGDFGMAGCQFTNEGIVCGDIFENNNILTLLDVRKIPDTNYTICQDSIDEGLAKNAIEYKRRYRGVAIYGATPSSGLAETAEFFCSGQYNTFLTDSSVTTNNYLLKYYAYTCT